MEQYIRDLAAREGWTDATTTTVLAGVLGDIVGMGIDADDLKAMIRRQGGVGDNDMPEVGDEVVMEGQDVVIEIEEVPDEQPESDEGVFAIVDQYGETHRVAREDGDSPWTVVIPAI